MTLASIFEDFSGPASRTDPASSSNAAGDPLEGYETGYKAGWDDALKAHQESNTHLTSVLARNLEQIEFTMIEAQNQVLSTLRPVLSEIMNTLLPSLSAGALEQLVLAEIEPLLKECAPGEIALAVSIADESTVATLLNSTRRLSEVLLEAKETVGEGQVYVTCPKGQRKVDVGAAISEIRDRIDSFLQQPELDQADAV